MKRQKRLFKRIKVPIYEVWLYVVIDHSLPEGIARLPKSLREANEEGGLNDDTAEARFLAAWPRFAIVFNRMQCDAASLAHELDHFCDVVMDQIGVKLRDINEPKSYLKGYVTSQVNKLLGVTLKKKK